MTLKDYTNFVVKFVEISNYQNIRTSGWNQFELVTRLDLGRLLGTSRWQKFVDVFMKKINWQGKEESKYFVFSSQVMKHLELFIPTLAEFCEPLISVPVSPVA